MARGATVPAASPPQRRAAAAAAVMASLLATDGSPTSICTKLSPNKTKQRKTC